MAKFYGLKVVHGVPTEIKPITGAPTGKHRLRLRYATAARLFVRSATGMRRFILEDQGETWFCKFEEGRNERRVECRACLPGANIRKAVSLNPNLCFA